MFRKRLDERGQVLQLLAALMPLFVAAVALVADVGMAGYQYLILTRTIDAAAFAAGMEIDEAAFEATNTVQIAGDACAIADAQIAANGLGLVQRTGCDRNGDRVTVSGSTTYNSIFGLSTTFTWTATAELQVGITEVDQ